MCRIRQPRDPAKSTPHGGGGSHCLKCCYQSDYYCDFKMKQRQDRIIQNNQMLKIDTFVGTEKMVLSNIWKVFSSMLSP